jgi:hypothetical protein
MQLDMFNADQNLFLIQELAKTKEMTENVRRGLFARYNALERMVLDLQYQIKESQKMP